MPEENKLQVVELLTKHNIPLIEDDVYGALSYEPKRPRAAKAYDQTGNVLYCSSFSKTVAPGLRIGWILAGQYQEQIIYQKFLDNISTTIYPQLTLAEFLSKGGYRRSIRHSARIYRQRMEQLVAQEAVVVPVDRTPLANGIETTLQPGVWQRRTVGLDDECFGHCSSDGWQAIGRMIRPF